MVYLLFKLARQMVGKGDTCEIVFAVGIWKTGIFAGNMDTDVGGRCKGYNAQTGNCLSEICKRDNFFCGWIEAAFLIQLPAA